jgi:2-dehydro-3-deoxyphosphogluconate aldolase / (4S)-4-hydroxy-2-oxoglutarate aldolase
VTASEPDETDRLPAPDPISAIRSQRLLAIVRSSDPAAAARALRALFDNGVIAAEISLGTPEALRLVRDAVVPTGAALGVGTVTDAGEAEAAIDAGATFLVTPVVALPVLATAAEAGIPVVCGAATPTEMLTATAHGAALVKVFPATLYGPSGLLDVQKALPHLALVPTGGVTVDNAARFVQAGAVAVGMGSALTDPSSGEPVGRRLADLLARLARSAEPNN